MNPKTKNTKISSKKGKSKKKSVKKKSISKTLAQSKKIITITEIFPIRKAVGNNGYLMNGGTYMNVFYVFPRDYYNMSETNVCLDILTFDKYYCTMREAIKFVCFSSNLDTTANQAYYYSLYTNSKNPVKRRVLREQIEILKNLEGREQKESFLFVYAETSERLKEINRNIENDFCAPGLARKMSNDEKEAVFKRLNNPFSHPTVLRNG